MTSPQLFYVSQNRAGPINFRIQAFEFASNDECDASETIVIETANTNTYTADLRTATESLDASCETASNTNNDLWFNFTMPVTGNLKIDQLTNLENVTVYDACGGTELSCQSGLQFVYGLIENTNYLLRVSSIYPVNRTPRFQAFPVAANDECSNSELLTVDTAGYIQYSIDTRTATESLDASCETASNDNLDLWYEFTMPVSGNLQVSNVTSQFRSTLFDTCSGNELNCFNGNGSFFNLAFGITYKLRVAQKSNEANSVNLRLQAFENIFNDDCATPQSITVEVDTFNDYAGNVSAATQSLISNCEPNSDSFIIQDVWYSFTMPIDGDLEIEDLTAGSNSGYFALYDACGNTDLQCFTNNGIFTNLTSGATYKLKTGLLSSQSGVLSFRLRAVSGTLGIEEHQFNNWSVFPNPTSNSFIISNNNKLQINNISIYDLSGRKVKNIHLNSAVDDVVINISALQNAMYLVVIKSENGALTKRILKQ